MHKKWSIYLMSLLYMAAGINHFWHPETYVRIMPPWLTAHETLVFISGIAETVLGAMLLISGTRKFAAWGIILLLIAVFPANIQMAVYWHQSNHPNQWLAWARLPLQIVLIWWAWRVSQIQQQTKKPS